MVIENLHLSVIKNLNLQQTSSADPISELNIDLIKADGTYKTNEIISGNVSLRISACHLDIVNFRLQLLGVGKLKNKKKEETQEDVIYLKKEWALVSSAQTVYESQKQFPFQEVVPPGVPTSIESKSCRIVYYLKATLTYKNNDGANALMHALRGLTLVEDVDLNNLPAAYFEEKPHTVSRKFGLFSCTGGHMKLFLNVGRTGFVCGESVSITGRIENKTDRRIEKVLAILQQRIIVGNDDDPTGSSIIETIDVHEDSLAMFVDSGAVIKIVKNMHIPVMAPSTPTEDTQGPSRANRLTMGSRKFSLGTLRSRPSQTSLSINTSRLLRVSYVLLFKVKSAGVDVMEICIPAVIGSIPLRSATAGQPNDAEAIYKQCKLDRNFSIFTTQQLNVLNKNSLTHVNKYPFFADLKTSSKQSKKISVLANTVRAETKIIHGMRSGTASLMSQTDNSSSIMELPEAAYAELCEDINVDADFKRDRVSRASAKIANNIDDSENMTETFKVLSPGNTLSPSKNSTSRSDYSKSSLPTIISEREEADKSPTPSTARLPTGEMRPEIEIRLATPASGAQFSDRSGSDDGARTGD